MAGTLVIIRRESPTRVSINTEVIQGQGQGPRLAREAGGKWASMGAGIERSVGCLLACLPAKVKQPPHYTDVLMRMPWHRSYCDSCSTQVTGADAKFRPSGLRLRDAHGKSNSIKHEADPFPHRYNQIIDPLLNTIMSPSSTIFLQNNTWLCHQGVTSSNQQQCSIYTAFKRGERDHGQVAYRLSCQAASPSHIIIIIINVVIIR